MRIGIVTPAAARSRHGNRVTALRWARLLRGLGHRVKVATEYTAERWDLLVALHARKSLPAVRRYQEHYPRSPVVVALTGTDLYAELDAGPEVQEGLRRATRLVVLQPCAINALPAEFRAQARVVRQSAVVPASPERPRHDAFEVCVLGHLRDVKDPLRTAAAARLVPQESRLRVLHVGAALTPRWAARATREMAGNPRYRWLGELSRAKALRVLARSQLLVLTSLLEGGANVVTEALAAGVPVLSTRIDGSIGILGPDYPGYFPVGDAKALARLLWRCERDATYYQRLRAWCRKLRPLTKPATERRAWAKLLAEL